MSKSSSAAAWRFRHSRLRNLATVASSTGSSQSTFGAFGAALFFLALGPATVGVGALKTASLKRSARTARIHTSHPLLFPYSLAAAAAVFDLVVAGVAVVDVGVAAAAAVDAPLVDVAVVVEEVAAKEAAAIRIASSMPSRSMISGPEEEDEEVVAEEVAAVAGLTLK